MSKHINKYSLGTLREAVRTKDRSPNLIGPLTLQPANIIEIHDFFRRQGDEGVTCNIAGWCYSRFSRESISRFRLSPLYVETTRCCYHT